MAVGTFLAGRSHELPTGGAGKSFPALTIDQFQRGTNVGKHYQPELGKSAPIVQTFAEMEGLDAQRRSTSIRLGN